MTTIPIRIPELNFWRGIFILMIFFRHVDLFPAGGTTGVAFFFLLGGFTMTLGYSERVLDPSFKYSVYLGKRASKYYPIHWVVLLLFCALNYLCGVPVSLNTFVPNFFLLQSFIPDRTFYYAYNSPAWYLCNTLFFAALFPFIISLFNKWRKTLVLRILCLILVLTFVVIEVFTPEEWRHAILYISPFIRLFDYVVGILAGLWLISYVKKGKEIERIALYIGGLLSLLLLVVIILLPNDLRMYSPIYWLPLMGLILFTSLISQSGGGKLLRNKVLISFGEVSYAFYMIHSFCIDVVKVVFSKMCYDNQVIYVSTAFILTVILSYVTTRCFINPVANKLTQMR